MKTKSIGLAAIVFGCSIGVAAAQGLGVPNAQAGGGPSAEQMQQLLNAAAKQRVAAGVAVGAPSSVATAENGSALPTGFNFFHATNCGWFTPNGADQWYYVFPLEGGLIASINNLNLAVGLETPCVNGNLFAINIINSSTNAFNQTLSFPYRP